MPVPCSLVQVGSHLAMASETCYLSVRWKIEDCKGDDVPLRVSGIVSSFDVVWVIESVTLFPSEERCGKSVHGDPRPRIELERALCWAVALGCIALC